MGDQNSEILNHSICLSIHAFHFQNSTATNKKKHKQKKKKYQKINVPKDLVIQEGKELSALMASGRDCMIDLIPQNQWVSFVVSVIVFVLYDCCLVAR